MKKSRNPGQSPKKILYYIRKVDSSTEQDLIRYTPSSPNNASRILLDLDNLHHSQTEIFWEQGKSLRDQIRPYKGNGQSFFFSFIRKTFLAQPRKGTEYFSLDIPLQIERTGYQLVRYVHFTVDDHFRLFLLNREKPYQGEPFFPRIGTEKSGSIVEETIPPAWRNATLKSYYEAADSRGLPFTAQPTELLKIYLKNPRIQKYQLKEELRKRQMGASENTINNHRKAIGKEIKKLFGVTLPDYGKSAAFYWHEMGLALPEIR